MCPKYAGQFEVKRIPSKISGAATVDKVLFCTLHVILAVSFLLVSQMTMEHFLLTNAHCIHDWRLLNQNLSVV